jgi:hypothetical protein
MKSFLEILPLENIPSSDEFVHKKKPSVLTEGFLKFKL